MSSFLLPTSNAAHFHILRMFHQVIQWIGEADNMETKDCGWSIEHNMCVPIRSSLPPAPDELLKTIYFSKLQFSAFFFLLMKFYQKNSHLRRIWIDFFILFERIFNNNKIFLEKLVIFCKVE